MFSSFTRSAVGLLVLFSACRTEPTVWPQPQAPLPLSADFGQWLSLDVAPDGRPVAAYYDRTYGALGFAVGQVDEGAIRWTHERVDAFPASNGSNPTDRGEYASMKVAPDGTVWIAYFSRTDGALYVSQRQGGPGSWSEPTLIDAGAPPSPATGLFNSLQLSASGQPVVSYHDAALGTLNIAHLTSSGWTHELLAEVGSFSALLIVDSTEYIAYYSAGQLKLAWGAAGAYQHTTVDTSTNVGQWPSLIARDGTLSIAYHDVQNQDLKVATGRPTEGFTSETVDAGQLIGADSAIFMSDGLVSVVYFDGYENNLKRATQVGQSWHVETLAGDDRAVGYHNAVVQLNGRWWVGSYDFTHRNLFTQPLP